MAYLTKKTYGEKLLDPRWQQKRLQIFQRDKFQCRRCGTKEKTLHLHHYIYEKGKEPWEAQDISLITLCTDCHKVEHIDRKLFTPLELGLIEMIRALTGYDFSDKDTLEKSVLEQVNELILNSKSNGK